MLAKFVLALPAAMRMPRWKPLFSRMMERFLLRIFATSGVFPGVCSGPLAYGPGSKEKFQSKDVFQLACGFINAPSQVGMQKAAAAALFCPFKTNGYATALAELLTHFEIHGAVVAAACVTKDVSEEFLLHFSGWSGILAHPLLFLVVPSSTHTDCENAELSACLHFDRNALERAYKGTDDAMGSVGIPMPGQDALRVGCGFTRKTLPGAAASMAPGSSLEAEKGGGSCQAIPDPEPTPGNPARPCLVRALSGRTLVCSHRVGYTLDDVERCVSERTGLPQHAVYLTFQGRLLSQEILGKRTCLVWFRWSRMAGFMGGGGGEGLRFRVPGHAAFVMPLGVGHEERCFRCGNPTSEPFQWSGPDVWEGSDLPGRALKPKLRW